MAKQLLIEAGFVSQINLTNELKESISLSAGKNNTLVVKNVPCTILNRKNLNGRIYTTAELQKAIKGAEYEILTKQLLCQACEHPEGTFVSPTTASHVVTKAYVKPNVEVVVEGTKGRYDVLFMDWEVLNTEEGKNLRALLEAECSLGVSIRGVGDMEGDTVINYELLGVDVVSNPSSGTFTRMPVKESVTLEVHENPLNEAFSVEAETVDSLGDINQASELLRQIGQDHTTTLSKSSLKFDSEVNPDTGAETNVAILTTNSSDDVDTLQQAMQLAGAKMASTIGTTDSVTISRIEDEDADANASKESVDSEIATSGPIDEAEVIDTEADGKSATIELDKDDLAQVGQDALSSGDADIEITTDDGHIYQPLSDSVEDEMNETLSAGKDAPSDPTIQAKEEVMNEDKSEVESLYEVDNLDFDIPTELLNDEEFKLEDLVALAQQMPDKLIASLKLSKSDALDYKKVLEKLSDACGLPLKSADIRIIQDLEKPTDDKEDK